MKKFRIGLLALCLLLLCSCSAAQDPSSSPSHRGTLPSQKPSQAPAQTQALEDSGAPEEPVQPTATPMPESTPEPTPTSKPEPTPTRAPQTWVLNTSTKKIHYPSCSSVDKIASKNYATSTATIDELLSRGYSRCGKCF